MKIILGVDAIKYPLTGIGRYTFELATGLQLQTDIDKLFFLRFGKIKTNSKIDFIYSQSNGHNFKNKIKNVLGAMSPIVKAYQLCQDWQQTKALKPYKNVVFHGPNYYLPNHNGPSLATFHDLSVFKYPEFHPKARRDYMFKAVSKSLRRADIIITDSQFIRAEMIEFSGFDPSRVLVIPLAASKEFHPRIQYECQAILNKFHLNYKSYMLYAGTVEPRKNLKSLLDAYDLLPETFRKNTPLVIAGYRGWRSDDIHERLKKASSAGWAKYLGFIDSEDLPFLYSSAKTFVYPSVYEGFGLPVLEALASGVPVVCSNASSLPEVAGDAALMCHHADVNTLFQMLIESAEDEAWRASAITKGLQHAQSFSWQRTVDQTLDAYKLAANL